MANHGYFAGQILRRPAWLSICLARHHHKKGPAIRRALSIRDFLEVPSLGRFFFDD
jgi:hypothetical protein